MQPAPILMLVIAALVLPACAALKSAGAIIPPPDAGLTAPCAHPADHLDVQDWELMAGRIGDDLILCGQRQAALTAYVVAIQTATNAK